jgi:DNA-binding SARP family transcriptional activator
MPTLEIRTLGTLDVHMEDGVIPIFEPSKARALLVFLAVESRRAHSRETLAGMLWPDRPTSAALANLRHTLASLRAKLGDRGKEQEQASQSLFNITSNTIQMKLGSHVWVDVGAFSESLEGLDQDQEADRATRISRFNEAVELYRGHFLEGFSIKGSLEFEDWMLLRRENLSQKFQKALRSLAAAYDAAGEWEEGLVVLRRLLQLEPWDESIHRKVMMLLAAHDQRSAALNQYHTCQKLLQDELGVEPESQTVQLYEQIREGKFKEPRITLPVKAHPGKPARPAFVGRQPQLASLYQSLDLTLKGHGQVVFIKGEAGSGKTSLAWEFANQVMESHPDLLFAAGRCNAITDYEDPFLPFREILQMLAGTNGTQSSLSLTAEHNRNLTEAFPDVIKVMLAFAPDLAGSFVPIRSLTQRVETFSPAEYTWQKEFRHFLDQTQKQAGFSRGERSPHEPLTLMLVELARHRPLVLFIDDLHWADTGSISLLHYLSKRLASSRVMILGAYRSEDLAMGIREGSWEQTRKPFEKVKLELQREFGEMEVDLDESDGLAFISELVDREPNCLEKTFRQTLFQQTNGNALFTLELLRSMQLQGQLVHDSEGRWVEGPLLEWDTLPARVEAVIAERTGRLMKEHQALLQAASVEGENFTAEITAAILGLPEDQVIEWLSGTLSREQQIVHATTVSRVSSGSGKPDRRLSGYRFSHTLFRRYLYHRLDRVERARLHEKTGREIEKLYGEDRAEMALPLAWHFEQAGLTAQAAGYLLAAGKQAINLTAHEQAKSIYDRCLALIKGLPESPQRTSLEVQVQLLQGAPLLTLEGWGSPKAVEAVNRAVELMNQSGGYNDDPSILLALYFQADYFNARNNVPEALARLDLLLERISAGVEPKYQMLAYTLAGQLYMFSGQPVTALEYLDKGISAYDPADLPFLTGVTGQNILNTCLTWMAIATWIVGYPGKARELGNRIIEEARKQSHPFYLANSLGISGAAFYAIQNEAGQAGEYARACLRLPESNRTINSRIMSTIVLGWVQVRQGEYVKGLEELRTGIEEWKATGSLTILPLSEMLLADALSISGQAGEALGIIQSVLETLEESGRHGLKAHALGLQGEILARERRVSGREWEQDLKLEACFEQAIQIAREQKARSFELRATTSLGRCLMEQGRAEEAQHRLEAIYNQFQEGVETYDLGEAKDVLAKLQAIKGQ